MKHVILSSILSIGCILCTAHPGVGIVADRKGNVYYTDLAQVWKIGLDGKKVVVVKGVHTHELFMDENDNLFGEHLWYNGERLNTWGYYVWRLSPDGKVEKIVPDTQGFREDYSFVRDHFGRMFWADRTGNCQKLIRRNVDNSTTQLGDHCFKNVRSMKSTKEGKLYVVDFQDLKKVDNDGSVRTIASQIADRKITQFTVDNQNSVMGVWDDRAGNIYTAIFSGRMVKRFSPAGKEEIVFTTSFPWSPSGGFVDEKGNLWVLECSASNSVRVEKLTPELKRVIY